MATVGISKIPMLLEMTLNKFPLSQLTKGTVTNVFEGANLDYKPQYKLDIVVG